MGIELIDIDSHSLSSSNHYRISFHLCIDIFFTGIAGIKLTKLIVPEYVYVNKPVELECQYVLQNNEKLYTVQWYKDNDEFYRFEKSGPRHAYQIDDIKVDVSTNE